MVVVVTVGTEALWAIQPCVDTGRPGAPGPGKNREPRPKKRVTRRDTRQPATTHCTHTHIHTQRNPKTLSGGGISCVRWLLVSFGKLW